MPSEEDKIADGINRPLMAVAVAFVVIGFILSITIALLPLGLVVMAVGLVGALVVFLTAKSQAKGI